MSGTTQFNFRRVTRVTKQTYDIMSGVAKALEDLEVTAVDRERGVITFSPKTIK